MKPLYVTIDVCHGPSSPCEEDGMWQIYTFADNKFNTDVEPTEYVKRYDRATGKVTAANPALRHKIKVGLAFWLSYHEHGDGVWALRGEAPVCQFDTVGLAGILVWEEPAANMGAKTVAERAKDARGFLDEYNQWANGYVHDWSVREPGEDDPVASGYGWIGTDGMMEEIVEAVGDRPVIAQGELAWMLKDGLYTKKPLTVVDADDLLEELLAE